MPPPRSRRRRFDETQEMFAYTAGLFVGDPARRRVPVLPVGREPARAPGSTSAPSSGHGARPMGPAEIRLLRIRRKRRVLRARLPGRLGGIITLAIVAAGARRRRRSTARRSRSRSSSRSRSWPSRSSGRSSRSGPRDPRAPRAEARSRALSSAARGSSVALGPAFGSPRGPRRPRSRSAVVAVLMYRRPRAADSRPDQPPSSVVRASEDEAAEPTTARPGSDGPTGRRAPPRPGGRRRHRYRLRSLRAPRANPSPSDERRLEVQQEQEGDLEDEQQPVRPAVGEDEVDLVGAGVLRHPEAPVESDRGPGAEAPSPRTQRMRAARIALSAWAANRRAARSGS